MNLENQDKFLAKDIIELAIEKSHDVGVIESLSDIVFCIMMIFDQAQLDSDVDWKEIFDILDRDYAAINNGKIEKLNTEEYKKFIPLPTKKAGFLNSQKSQKSIG